MLVLPKNKTDDVASHVIKLCSKTCYMSTMYQKSFVLLWCQISQVCKMQEIIPQLERLFLEMSFPDCAMLHTLISSSAMYVAVAVAAAIVLYILHDLIVSASIPTLVVPVTDGKHDTTPHV